MTETTVFICVYIGMILGGVPGLAIDRTGIALLGALALIGFGSVSIEEAWASVDVPTMALLFGLMIVSAQLRLGGFYTAVTRRIAAAPVPPATLLAFVVAVAGVLSAFLSNDIVCLAMAPILVEGCLHRKLNPLPYLLALACASNIGSAGTLIGNPQNMLIGQRLSMPFGQYALDAFVPTCLGLVVSWYIIQRQYRDRWTAHFPERDVAAPTFNPWQTGKGIAVLAAIVVAFLFAPIPREVVALGAAGLLLASRKMATRPMLGLVDWHLLVLFGGLFVVNHAIESAGVLGRITASLRAANVDIEQPAWLFGSTAVLSNIVSNVPATMLLLPSATHPMAGLIMALSSTLVGNFIIVSSIANIIVVEQAGIVGIRMTWSQHARTGIPVTLITLAIAAAWIYVRL